MSTANRAEISGPARKFFCSALPGINVLQICKMVYKYYSILELFEK